MSCRRSRSHSWLYSEDELDSQQFITRRGCRVGYDLAARGRPIDSLEYWEYLYPKLHIIISEDHGSVVGEAGQDRDCQSTLNECTVGISEATLKYCFIGNFEIPKILGREDNRDSELLEEFSRPRGCNDY